MRTNCHIHENAHLGNFVEMKKADFGAGSKASHLTYVGDAQVLSLIHISWEILNQIGKWNYYGKKAVRGWSSLSKEDIKQFLMKHLKCNEDTIDVINANNELFRMRF